MSEPKSGSEPVAWIIPGDENGRENGFIDAMWYQDGEFTRPLYAHPPGVSVPDEPTEEMIEALYGKYLSPTCHKSRIEGYKAMIAAAKKEKP